MTAPDRIPCLVLGCRRTAPGSKYPPNTRIICGKCWRLAPKTLRRAARRLEQRIEEVLGRPWSTIEWDQIQPDTLECRLLVIRGRIFDRILKHATEAKVGIG